MRHLLYTTGAILVAFGVSGPVSAQDAKPQAAEQTNSVVSDIIVTARKRNESSLDVPVSITALGKEQLARYGTDSLTSLSTQVPGFFASDASSSGTLAIRGISSSPGNPAADQGVSVNIDGLQVGSPLTLRLAEIDLAQVEVLKGPQALFFGKNSPGGIVSLRTADPGNKFEAKMIVSHEFDAAETAGQLTVSGPITSTLGARVTLYGNRIEGYEQENIPVVPGISYGPQWGRTPHQQQFYGRATVVFKPTPNLSFRAKYSHSILRGSGPFGQTERIYCPNGGPQTLGLPTAVDDCHANGVTSDVPVLSPALYAAAAAAGFHVNQDGRTAQDLGSLEGNLTLARGITLTSLTGYYKLTSDESGNAAFQPASVLGYATTYTRREITQEVRVVTARSDWPVNFTAGAFYQDLKLPNSNILFIDLYAFTHTLPLGNFFTSGSFYNTTGSTYSAFGQAIWKVTPQIELSGGGRYSSEKKSISVVAGATVATLAPVPLTVDTRTFTNFSPEVTLSYKPVTNVNIFGSYRVGFKSGGFNAAGSGGDLSYLPENIRGFEAGVKGKFSDIRVDGTVYDYKYTNAQTYTFNPTTLAMTVLNAASARIKGIEGDITWGPRSIPGLEIHGSMNYNHARYLQFNLGCYTGQTIAEGCRVGTPIGGAFNQQNLNGAPLVLAPDWTGDAGFAYGHDLDNNGLRMSVTGDISFSSAYVTILEDAPGGTQQNYRKINASVRLNQERRGWELALIGVNLTDQHIIDYSGGVPLTGSAAATGTNTTGGQADLYGFISRGREIKLQLSVTF